MNDPEPQRRDLVEEVAVGGQLRGVDHHGARLGGDRVVQTLDVPEVVAGGSLHGVLVEAPGQQLWELANPAHPADLVLHPGQVGRLVAEGAVDDARPGGAGREAQAAPTPTILREAVVPDEPGSAGGEHALGRAEQVGQEGRSAPAGPDDVQHLDVGHGAVNVPSTE